MLRLTRPFVISLMLCAMMGSANAVTLPEPAGPGVISTIPARGLLCGNGWHYSFYYFKCERNRHRCPAGTHWISLLKVCV